MSRCQIEHLGVEMSDNSSYVLDICNLIVSFIYRLTVGLVLELIKVGALLFIVIGSCLMLGLAYFALITGVYTYFDYSILAATIGFVLTLPVLALALKLVQYVVKDFLQLTDMALVDFFRYMVVGGKRNKNKKDS